MFLFQRKKTISTSQAAVRIILLVGLGNPGREYRENRHNVGFMVIDRLAESLRVNLTRVQNKALVGTGTIGDSKIVLAKPQTYMNLSGEAVAGLIRFYKIPAEDMMVIHDDIDLPFGILRLRPGGGSAGQKGVQSIIDRLGTQEFPRMRVGIGRPPGSRGSSGYVLKNFSPDEKKELGFVIDNAVLAARLFVTDGLDAAMNRYNGSQLGE